MKDLFIEVNNRMEMAETINEDLNNIQTWMNNWLVIFSVAKTKSLTICNKKDSNLKPYYSDKWELYWWSTTLYVPRAKVCKQHKRVSLH